MITQTILDILEENQFSPVLLIERIGMDIWIDNFNTPNE